MNISNVSVRLTEEDILSIVKDFLQLDEIKIESISIKDNICIKGKVIKGVKLNFEARVVVHDIRDNILGLKILNIKLGKMPIAVSIASFIAKKLIKSIENMGMFLNGQFFLIDFSTLCKFIPQVSFILMHITTLKGGLEVELKNLIYSESKQAVSLKELKDKIEESSENKEQCGENLRKTVDKYTDIREDIKENIPEKFRGLGEYLLALPDIAALLYRLMKDNRVSSKTKLLIGGVLGYLVLPSDIIPDFIPLLGKGDDFGIAFLVLDKILTEVPTHIILEHWQGKDEIIQKFIGVNNELIGAVGRKNAVRIFSGAIVFLKKKRKR